MRKAILLLAILVFGCSSPPAVELPSGFEGTFYQEKEPFQFTLDLVQDGNQLTGQYRFWTYELGRTLELPVFGKLTGRVEENRVHLELRVDPRYRIDGNLSPTLEMALVFQECSAEEKEALPDDYEALHKLEGAATLVLEGRQTRCRGQLYDLVRGNPFNKELTRED